MSALYQSQQGKFDTDDGEMALQYLEQQGPPRIEAEGVRGTPYTLYVPNNDQDVIAKDYARHGASNKNPKDYTTNKQMQPYIAKSARYVWDLPPNMTEEQMFSVALLCRLAGEVPVLGLGIDPVTVCCRQLDVVEPLAGAQLYVPDDISKELVIDIPIRGLLEDAKRRHAEFLKQVTPTGFVKPSPITRKKGQGYRKDGPLASKLIEYRIENTESKHMVPSRSIPELLAKLRTMCGVQLGDARIVVLPSIGHRYADTSVRRVGLLIPSSMSSTARDRLCSALDARTVAVKDMKFQLVLVDDSVGKMYGKKSCVWRSVTPLDLGEDVVGKSVQSASDLLASELDEKGLKNVMAIRLDKVPDWNGLERLPHGSNLWYAEIEFRSPVEGPLILGQGVEQGHGLLAPAMLPDVAYYVVVGTRPPITKTVKIADAVRTAVMSQAGRLRKDRYIPQSLSGHDKRGKPLRNDHSHAFWLPVDNDGDGLIDHIVAYAKSGFEPSTRRAFAGVVDVHNKHALVVSLRFVGFRRRSDLAKHCSSFGKGSTWISSTPYYTPWHSKANFGVVEQIEKDLKNQHMPAGKIAVDQDRTTPLTNADNVPLSLFDAYRTGRTPPLGVGHRVTILFSKDVDGPINLGANSHFGLGAFLPYAAPDKKSSKKSEDQEHW